MKVRRMIRDIGAKSRHGSPVESFYPNTGFRDTSSIERVLHVGGLAGILEDPKCKLTFFVGN